MATLRLVADLRAGDLIGPAGSRSPTHTVTGVHPAPSGEVQVVTADAETLTLAADVSVSVFTLVFPVGLR